MFELFCDVGMNCRGFTECFPRDVQGSDLLECLFDGGIIRQLPDGLANKPTERCERYGSKNDFCFLDSFFDGVGDGDSKFLERIGARGSTIVHNQIRISLLGEKFLQIRRHRKTYFPVSLGSVN